MKTLYPFCLAALLMVAGCNNSSNTNTKDMANNEPFRK